METTNTNITSALSSSLNSLFSNLFSSLDNNLYAVLDDLTFIDTNIYDNKFFSILTSNSPTSGILLISNSLVFGFLIFFTIKLILSNFCIINNLESPSHFIFKLIICTLLMNFSFYLCKLLISFNSILSLSIRSLGEDIFDISINFSTLVDKINTILLFNSSIDIFSLDGILKSIISIGFFNLTFSYSLRFIMIQVFILISPFAILSLCHNSTSFLFKSWIRCFLSLLFLQILISIILLATFTILPSYSSLLSKFLYIGSIFALIKANTYIKDLFGGVGIDLQTNISSISPRI